MNTPAWRASPVTGDSRAPAPLATTNPRRPKHRGDEWKRLLAGAKIGDYTLHEARHTSVTRAREAGVPDHAVAEWHGHDENVMRQTYSHPSQESLREVASALFGS